MTPPWFAELAGMRDRLREIGGSGEQTPEDRHELLVASALVARVLDRQVPDLPAEVERTAPVLVSDWRERARQAAAASL